MKFNKVLPVLSVVALSFALMAATYMAKSDHNTEKLAQANETPINQGLLQAGSSRQGEEDVLATSANETYGDASLHTAAWADTHSDVCLANYRQCLKGCDGATSCSNQCKVNYDNCMKQ